MKPFLILTLLAVGCGPRVIVSNPPPATVPAGDVPAYLGQCMLKTVSGALISSANRMTETIYIVCNQPICPAPELAILDIETGKTGCKL